jgi:L-seryl-tRNA(Ser) seleniumtransferase
LDIETAVKRIPTLFFLSQSGEDIKRKAFRLLNKIKKLEYINKNIYNFKIIEDLSIVGGGALPDYELKTYSISIVHKTLSANKLSQIFRSFRVPIIGKIKNEEFLIDVRTVLDIDFKDIMQALKSISDKEYEYF